jgi:hypothetical protein
MDDLLSKIGEIAFHAIEVTAANSLEVIRYAMLTMIILGLIGFFIAISYGFQPNCVGVSGFIVCELFFASMSALTFRK